MILKQGGIGRPVDCSGREGSCRAHKKRRLGVKGEEEHAEIGEES